MRKATLTDIDELVSQRHSMFEDISHRTDEEHRVGDEGYRKWLKELTREKKLVCFLVTDPLKGKVAGGGCVWLRDVQPRPGARLPKIPYLLSMYTQPEFRRLGVATAIVKEAIKWCRKNGYSTMTLHASPMGRSVYEKLGFERTWEMRIKF